MTRAVCPHGTMKHAHHSDAEIRSEPFQARWPCDPRRLDRYEKPQPNAAAAQYDIPWLVMYNRGQENHHDC
jgi:hypothetical protein